jgi:RNA polymerase sigma-70 factor (ECF subfamily)
MRGILFESAGSALDRAQLESCITRIGRGNREAFHEFYLLVKDTVFRFALSMVHNRQLAEDVLQDFMLRIAAAACDYQTGTNPRAWMMSIVRNLCYDELKGASRKDVSLEDIDTPLPAADDTALMIEAAEDAFIALKVLTQKEREIVSLYVFAGLKQTEIADMLHLSYTEVRSKYKYAIKKMRNFYERTECFPHDKKTVTK